MNSLRYLVDWHNMFEKNVQTDQVSLELWFDRGPYAPVVETIYVSKSMYHYEIDIVSDYVSALINNVVCVYGARRIDLIADDMRIAKMLLIRVRYNVLHAHEMISNMSLEYLFGLVNSYYASRIVIEGDRRHVSLLDKRQSNVDRMKCIKTYSGRSDKKCLAINIGQRLTSWAMVPEQGKCLDVACISRESTKSLGFYDDFFAALTKIIFEIKRKVCECATDFISIGISIAATVISGQVIPVTGFGLFFTTVCNKYNEVTRQIENICQTAFPGKQVVIANDGEAQAIFSFRYALDRGLFEIDNPNSHILSLRFGACPCVGCVDSYGNTTHGFNEYSWLITKLNCINPNSYKFLTSRYYVSHYGVAAVAYDLGLLEKYNVNPCAAYKYFFDNMLSKSENVYNDSILIYNAIGRHVAALAYEVHRHQSIDVIMLLGSISNNINESVFLAIHDGFVSFAENHGLPFSGNTLQFAKDTSSFASLVGVALKSFCAIYNGRGSN